MLLTRTRLPLVFALCTILAGILIRRYHPPLKPRYEAISVPSSTLDDDKPRSRNPDE